MSAVLILPAEGHHRQWEWFGLVEKAWPLPDIPIRAIVRQGLGAWNG
jgi:hypothetical protein